MNHYDLPQMEIDRQARVIQDRNITIMGLEAEVSRLQQRERDLQTVVRCAEGNYEELYSYIKRGSYDRIN